MKIAIIGAGFAGLAATISLKGNDITLYERAENLSPVGAGVLLQPFGLTLLRQLEIYDDVVACGDKIKWLHGLSHSDKCVLDLKYEKVNPGFFGLGIHRGALFNAILQKAIESEPKLKLNATVLGIESIDSKPILITDNYKTETYDLVIISNGGKSKLRKLANTFQYEKEYGWGALWGVFENKGLAKDTLYQRYKGTDKLLGFLPCGVDPISRKKIVSLFWSLHKNKHQRLLDDGIEMLKKEMLRLDAATEHVYDEITSFENFSFVTYTNVYLHKWKQGNVLFIGACAHGMSPQLGLGANMALYDGLLIGKILKANHNNISSLEHLHQIRRGQVLYYHLTSRLLTKFFQSDYAMLGAVRDLLFPLFPKINFMDKIMLETLCGIKNGLATNIDLNKIFDRLTK